MIIGLEKLVKKPRPVLIAMAKREGITVSKYWKRITLATKILEKRKLDELEDKPPETGPEPGESKLKPEFEEALADDRLVEDAESGPGLPQEQKDAGEGPFVSPGRTPGLTDEKARIERIMKNQVPDPVYLFFLNKFFNGWQRFAKDVPGIKLSKDEAKLVGIPTTNLMTYYFPNLHISPVLESWFGLYMSLELVIGSRLDLIKAARAEGEPEQQAKNSVVSIMERLKVMSVEQVDQFAVMLGVKGEKIS